MALTELNDKAMQTGLLHSGFSNSGQGESEELQLGTANKDPLPLSLYHGFFQSLPKKPCRGKDMERMVKDQMEGPRIFCHVSSSSSRDRCSYGQLLSRDTM